MLEFSTILSAPGARNRHTPGLNCAGFVTLLASMRMRLYCLAGSLLLIAAFSGCGTPGAPQPPSLQLARPVDDLTASRKGNRVELDWTLQRKNTDRTLVKHLPAIRICRREGTGLMSACAVVAEIPPPKPQLQPKQKGKEESPAIRMHYLDSLPPQLGQENPVDFVTYAVEEINSHGRSAGLSNQVPIPVAPTIPAPNELSAQVSGEGVRISWSGPAPRDAHAFSADLGRQFVGGRDGRSHRNRHLIGEPGTAPVRIDLFHRIGDEVHGILLPQLWRQRIQVMHPNRRRLLLPLLFRLKLGLRRRNFGHHGTGAH